MKDMTKSNIQRKKEEIRQSLKLNKYKASSICTGNDYIGFELFEKDENDENYFQHIDESSTAEEVKEFLKIPVSKIKAIYSWFTGIEYGAEYMTNRDVYECLTYESIRHENR